jgi:hypothetical protein
MSDTLLRKTCRFLAAAILILLVATSGVFLVRFPDAPLHRCIEGRHYLYEHDPDGYCGKQGQPHGAADYAAFARWGNALAFAWPLGMMLIITLDRYGRRSL